MVPIISVVLTKIVRRVRGWSCGPDPTRPDIATPPRHHLEDGRPNVAGPRRHAVRDRRARFRHDPARGVARFPGTDLPAGHQTSGTSTSRLPTWLAELTTPCSSICSTRRAALL